MPKLGLKKIKTVGSVTEYRLEGNGLRVLYRKSTAVPLVAICVTYHVGSRNEAPGHTGSTHILEHLLFKDSEHFNRANGNAITDYLEWLGAATNATTWLDRTNYFEMLPREHAEKAIAMEADRMRGARFTAQDLATEMPVVRNEYEIGRNNPFELLDEELMASAFTTHPYRIPTIGSKEDIEASTAEKLREFYDTFYWPNNATLTVLGDISEKEMKRLVEKHFGKVPGSSKPIPPMAIKEPVQKAKRAVSLKKPGGVKIASVAYKIPEGRHKDYPAIVLAGTMLAGGFSSRLQQKLVDTGLAAEVMVAAPALHDPGVLTFTAHLSQNTDPVRVLASIRSELKAFTRNVKEAELARAKERILTAFGFERDGIFSELMALSEAIAAGDWSLSYRLESSVKKASLTDVKAAVRKYFVDRAETSGVLLSA